MAGISRQKDASDAHATVQPPAHAFLCLQERHRGIGYETANQMITVC